MSVLNKSSEQTEMSVSVCTYCTRCFKVASQFPMCRDTFSQMPQLVNDITRILYFKVFKVIFFFYRIEINK